MRKLSLVLTGSGRCATGFYARYLTSAGLSTGHERFFGPGGLQDAIDTLALHWKGTDGESSWMAAPFLDSPPLADAFIVHLIRHPQDVIQSWLRVPTSITPQYQAFAESILPGLRQYRDSLIDYCAYRWLEWNSLIERMASARQSVQFCVENEPLELLRLLGARDIIDLDAVRLSKLFDNRKFNTKQGTPVQVHPGDIHDEALRTSVLNLAGRYGYTWEDRPPPVTVESQVVKAVVTTLDNLPNLRQTVAVLRQEGLREIIVVNNGSRDGTAAWLESQEGLTVINRENKGAGPGRNAGIDAAGDCDFFLMLDGGIRPLRGGTQRMLNYLDRCKDADVIGVEIPDFEKDIRKAWRRWPGEIMNTYHNRCLSHTAYGLVRGRAFNGLRFSEEGPFGEPGWGADDDEMMCQWLDAGIVVHVATKVHPYRHASGSFRRLFQETGVWPTDYGSVYEKRVVWLSQNWPQYEQGGQWGEPYLTVVVDADSAIDPAGVIKTAHDKLRLRHFHPPWEHIYNPYSIVAWGNDPIWLEWAEPRRLRQHHGNKIILDGEIVRRTAENEATWTGDFRVWTGENYQDAIRPAAHYCGLVSDLEGLTILLDQYNELHPPVDKKTPPKARREWLHIT